MPLDNGLASLLIICNWGGGSLISAMVVIQYDLTWKNMFNLYSISLNYNQFQWEFPITAMVHIPYDFRKKFNIYPTVLVSGI